MCVEDSTSNAVSSDDGSEADAAGRDEGDAQHDSARHHEHGDTEDDRAVAR